MPQVRSELAEEIADALFGDALRIGDEVTTRIVDGERHAVSS